MMRLNFFFAVFWMAAMQLAEGGVPSASARQRPVKLGPGDTLGPSYPNETEYVKLAMTSYHLAMALDAMAVVDGNYADCGPVAASKGAPMYIGQNGLPGCRVATLRFPLCSTRTTGAFNVYVISDFLSDGQETDGAAVNSLHVSMEFPHGLVAANDLFQSFRIQDPTILTLQQFSYPLSAITSPYFNVDVRVLILDNGSPVYVPAAIVADPACYSNSTCAVPFLKFTDEAEPPSAVLSDFCDGTIAIPAGEELNILSHARIGCELFPDSYPPCNVSFSGTDALKLKITYTDFIGADNCDGFDVTIITDVQSGSPSVVDLCQTGAAEVDAPLGSGQVLVSGSTASDRDKYGFIINISYD